MHQLIARLYDEKNQAGAWKRWLTLGNDQAGADALKQSAQSVHGQYSDMIVLGIGGSSLGGYAFYCAPCCTLIGINYRMRLVVDILAITLLKMLTRIK